MSQAYSMEASQALNTNWDAVVVGGGMVGAATALGLGQAGFRVLVLEKAPINTHWDPHEPYQMRVSALTRASQNILQNMGAWSEIMARRAHPFQAMHVWESQNSAELHFAAQDIDEPNLGHIVENNIIQAALWKKIEQCPQIDALYAQHLEAMHILTDQVQLDLKGLGTLTSKVLIGADGAFSRVRHLANIGLSTHDYDQCAVVGCVKTEKSHQDTCWQGYQASGPFAFLAMQDNMSSIAWYLPTDKMEWALSLNDADFAQAISQASNYRLGPVLEVNERSAFPLVRRHANHYVKPRLALIGDAAHTIHPQAGQGVNLGLLDAAALVETLVTAKKQQKDWGKHAVLRQYERWRKGDNVIVQRGMEGLDWFFKQDNRLKNTLRSPLLRLANESTWAKGWLMSQTLNGRDVLPKMAQQSTVFDELL